MFIYCICTQYLVGAFALITASVLRGMEVISLWHCWGGMEAQVSLIAAFRSSALLGLVSLIFLLTIPHRFSMGFRSGEFAGQSSTVTPWSLNQLLVPLAVWAGAKSCWKMNEWMMHLYSAFIVYCHTPKALYNHVGGHSSTTTSVQHPLGWCDGSHRTTAPVRSPHTSYRWRGERDRANQVDMSEISISIKLVSRRKH